MCLYSLLRPLLLSLEPETAHRLVLAGLKSGLAPSGGIHHESLKTKLWNREFQNPLGLAAGFDKDAEVLAPAFKMGFGFVEAGTVTPLPQAGNDRPRVFRDVANESIINRMGFPGKGLEVFAENILAFRKKHPETKGILGVNIGINKNTASPVNDYRLGIERLAESADYIAVNVSSPNTAGLRDLQAKEELDRLLAELTSVMRRRAPLLLKVAPDLTPGQRADIAETVLRHGVDGLVVSNTTVTRPVALAENLKSEKGGLSGRLLKDLSTETIRDFYCLTRGAVPIIGVGGVSSAEDAYEKIRAGASLVQVYTALVYQGPTLITRILDGLETLLRNDGFRHVSEAVGISSATGKEPVKAVL